MLKGETGEKHGAVVRAWQGQESGYGRFRLGLYW